MSQLSDAYELSLYKDFGPLEGKEKIHLVRNEQDASLCVKKILRPESAHIYTFLKQNPSPCFPEIRVCSLQEEGLIVIEEYVEGETLARRVERQCFEEAETVRIVLAVCDALKKLHNAHPPIICRDVKAENIILTENGQVKLVDFDIAREYEEDLDHDTEALGTRGYAAPEQFGFSQTDARTDIYALGVLINYMRTGKFPEEEKLTGNLGTIVSTCMQLNPGERFQNVEALSAALNSLQTGETGTSEEEAEPEDKQGEKKAHVSWAPPGFRTRKPWKMIVAILVYAYLTGTCATMEFSDDAGTPEPMTFQVIARVAVWLAFMASIFFIWDYRGIREKIPFFNPKNQFLRILVDILVIFIFIFVGVILASMLIAFLI